MEPRQLVEAVTELASLPGACARVIELADDPMAGAADLAEVITLDPGLAARLLRLVNSAYFARAMPVEDLATAVQVVGTDGLRNLALATGALSVFRGIPSTLVDMDSFWNSSVHCGLLARSLGRIARHGGPERLFAAGLLHAVGELVMYHCEPERSSRVLAGLAAGTAPREALERAEFGFTSAAVGAALLESWRLPASLVEPVRWQLAPLEAPAFVTEAALLHVAREVTASAEPGIKVGATTTPAEPAIAAGVWARSGLVADVLPAALNEVDAQWFEVIEILSPGALAY